MGAIEVDLEYAMTTAETPTDYEEYDAGLWGAIFNGYNWNFFRIKLILGGVVLTFFLTSILLFISEYRRRRILRLKEIALIRETNPDAEFDDEDETFWMYCKNNLADLRDRLPVIDCSKKSKDADLKKVVTDGGSGVEESEYQDIDDYRYNDYASPDAERKQNEVILAPPSLDDDNDYYQDLKLIDELAAAAKAKSTRMKQLKKQASQDSVASSHLEIIYKPDEMEFEMQEVEDDPESESWFTEKYVDPDVKWH